MLRPPVSTIITLASRIADEHPRAAPLAYRIRTEAEELRAEPMPRDLGLVRFIFDHQPLPVATATGHGGQRPAKQGAT
jgi:hypothetical protein